MTKPYPTYRQREVLQFLMQGDWVPILRLIPVGEKLLGNLLQVGWIERGPDLKTADLYRITEAGRVAFRTTRHGTRAELFEIKIPHFAAAPG